MSYLSLGADPVLSPEQQKQQLSNFQLAQQQQDKFGPIVLMGTGNHAGQTVKFVIRYNKDGYRIFYILTTAQGLAFELKYDGNIHSNQALAKAAVPQVTNWQDATNIIFSLAKKAVDKLPSRMAPIDDSIISITHREPVSAPVSSVVKPAPTPSAPSPVSAPPMSAGKKLAIGGGIAALAAYLLMQ